MIFVRWDELPEQLKTQAVRNYYQILEKKKTSLFFKRIFDIIVSFVMLVALSPMFLILAVAIKLDSKGPVFYRQERVTAGGRHFRIHKFRSMVSGADKKGTLVTVKNDSRVTRVGKIIRRCRLDEICQLIDVLKGDMTFVGTRPEVPKYVDAYTDEMNATLLLPAGVTSLASIYYKDEDLLLDGADNTDEVYIAKVLPDKMYYNLMAIEKFSFFGDIKLMFMTVFAVLGKEYKDETRTEETDSVKGSTAFPEVKIDEE